MAWTESHLGGSGGGGASSLADLGDVALSSLTDNQLLKYNASSGKWENSSGDGQKFQPVIYSTEEREIGVWTDGKPLYEITVELSSVVSITNNSWTVISDCDTIAATIDKVILGVGYLFISAGGGYQPIAVQYVSNHIQVQLARFYSPSDITALTLRYTKTTDAPGSGTWTPQGVPAVHYSTDEQIIGTWIDGSTIYEKTFVLDNQLEVSSTSWTSTGITASYISAIFGVEMFGVSNYQGGGLANIQNSVIQLQATRNSNAFPKSFVLRYTKSSS